MTKGRKFPVIKAKSLSGKEVVFPDDAQGEVTLIGIAFVREAQPMLDSWVEYFEEICHGKNVYEVPMIEGGFWKILSGFIDEGMRAGIPKGKHDYVVTYYGDASAFRKELEMHDKNKGYVFLLDEIGKIAFKGEGYADENGKKQLLEHLRKTCAGH